MSSYESKTWGVDVKTGKPALVPVPSWEIGNLMAHHHDCRVRVELRRSVQTGDSTERRLELAQATACTCGRTVEMNKALTAKLGGSVDRRDNRDPVAVGREYLNR